MLYSQLLKHVSKYQENMISDLEKFIAIPSVSSDKVEVENALNYIINLADNMGFKTEIMCDHQVGTIEFGEGDETIGILAHVDVVPVGVLSDWKSNPFKLDRREGKLYGRGTIDDKGPIIVCLYVMKILMEQNIPMKKKIRMILGTQEEVEWVDMNQYVKEFPLPDYGFTPDGEFPVCNIEKGIIDCDMKFPIREEAITKNHWIIKNLLGGIMNNAIPSKAEATIVSLNEYGNVIEEKIVANGVAVHSSEPAKGVNAIYRLAEKIITDDRGIRGQLFDIISMLKYNFDDIYGVAIGANSLSEYYNNEFVDRNTFSITKVFVKEDSLFAHINVRFSYGSKSEEILRALKKVAEEYDAELTNITSMPAVFVSKNRPFIKVFSEAYEYVSGMNPDCVLAYGGSYAKAMPNIVSWGPLFPGDEDTCHENNEYFEISRMIDNGKIFLLALANMVWTDISYK